MSAKNLADIRHYSKHVAIPLTRALAVGIAGTLVYLAVSPSKFVERIPPHYVQYRKEMGLPDVPLKHPGPFGIIKELRIIPKEEEINRSVN